MPLPSRLGHDRHMLNSLKRKRLVVGLSLLIAALAVCVIFSPTVEPPPCPLVEPCPDCPQVSCPDCPQCPQSNLLVPFETEWATSPHNDLEAESFRHWDNDKPPEIPSSCAGCHSTPGFIDYMGADGSEIGIVDAPSPVGTTVECSACHNNATLTHDSVVFPSGLELIALGDQAICMECHQGRASKVAVEQAITEAVGDDLDTVDEALSFIDIHYATAAVTRYGTEVKGGYEYQEQQYDPRFDHVQGYQSCTSCHDMHTLQINIDDCAACHTNNAGLEDAEMIRLAGSLNDYDGDGDVEESIKAEISGLQEFLYTNIQAYAEEVAGTPITYDPGRNPFFFNDAGRPYESWTGRLVQAAYNFHLSHMDQGAFAHGGKYLIQLLYDSIADLNAYLNAPIDLSGLRRDDPGHFAASHASWRLWDEAGEVPASCSKCHSSGGLPAFFSSRGDSYPQPTTSGLSCTSCHDDLSSYTRYEAQQVTFPSGAVVAFDNLDANLCLVCHQGPESVVSVDELIASSGADDDEVSETLSPLNLHFFAAGAGLFGSQVGSAYEYQGQLYNGRFMHVPGFQDCTECHDTHQLQPKLEECRTCHGTATMEDLEQIRLTFVDFDGDGETNTGLAVEIRNMQDALFAALQTYAAEVSGSPIAFDPDSSPYWFIDKNENGIADPGESSSANSYRSWTPRLLRAAYNYAWTVNDPGSFVHNGRYTLQVLYDSLVDIGGDISGMSRPDVTQ